MKNLVLIIIIILVVFNCFINGLLNDNLKSDKGIIAKKIEKDKPFFGLFAIPYIICFFAAKGFWPPYPFFMQRKVDEMGRYVFSMDDNGIRNFCAGIMPINFCFRPFGFKGYLLSKFFCFNNTLTTPTTTELPETIPPTEPPTDPPTEPPTDPPTTTTTTTTTICACAQPQKLQIENSTTLHSLTHILLHTTFQPSRSKGRKTTSNPRKKSTTVKPYRQRLKFGDNTITANSRGVISTATDNRTHFPPFPVRINNKIVDDLTHTITTSTSVLSHTNFNYTRIASKLNIINNFHLGPYRPQVNPFDWRYTTRLPTTRRTTTRRTSPLVTLIPTQLTTQSTTTTALTTTASADDNGTMPPTTTPLAVNPTDDVEIITTTIEPVASTTDILGRLVNRNQKRKTVAPVKKANAKPTKRLKTTRKPTEKLKNVK